MKQKTLFAVLVCLCIFDPVTAFGQESLTCVVANDLYILHFTAYQQPEAGAEVSQGEMFKSYCEELPHTGLTYLTVDLMDADVRRMPVAVKVVEEEKAVEDDGETMKPVRTLAEIVPKAYPKGVIEAKAELDKPGYYAVLLSIGDGSVSKEARVRIPLRVAIQKDKSRFARYGTAIMLFVGVAALLFLLYKVFARKPAGKDPVI